MAYTPALTMCSTTGRGDAKNRALAGVMAAPINLLGNPPNPPSPEAMTGLTLAELNAQIPGILGYISSISVQLWEIFCF